jgi:hypothetical protein
MLPDVNEPAADVRPDPLRIQAAVNAVLSLHHQEARGDLAALRRMDVEQPIEPAFQRILVKVWPEAGIGKARRLALFVKVLALAMSADLLKGPRQRLGEVMADPLIDVKERRVQMLMTARGPALDDAVLRLARRLVQAGRLPFHDLGRLLLGSEEAVERTRFDIAKAYWAAAGRQAPSSSQNANQGDFQ